MKKRVASRLKDIIERACKRENVLYTKRGLRRAKKEYLTLSYKDKMVAIS